MSTVRSLYKAAPAALVASLLSFAPAAHAEIGVPIPKNAAATAKSVAGTGKARFDWLEQRGIKTAAISQPQTRSKTRIGKSLGSGSWICSPAGFGKKSRCRRR